MYYAYYCVITSDYIHILLLYVTLQKKQITLRVSCSAPCRILWEPPQMQLVLFEKSAPEESQGFQRS